MLFYEQVEQLHHPTQEWKLEARDHESQTEGIAQKMAQTRKADNSIEAPPAEDHNGAEANVAPTVAEARLPPEYGIEPARHEPRMVEQSETPVGILKETRPADADSYITPSVGAASDLSAVEQTNRTELAHVNLNINTRCPNVRAGTPPSYGSSNTVISTFATTLPPPRAVEVIKTNRQITPALRTAPPRKIRGSISRGGQGIGKISSMVTAN